MKNLLRYSLFFAMLTAITACNHRKPVIELEQDNSDLVKENMINANRVVIQSENTQIDSYVSRRGWKMNQLPSGALYMIVKQGQGEQIAPDDRVEVSYRLERLDGSPFYTNQVDTLTVGKREVTVALDEMLQQLNYGSQAWLIAPSNSAYGVVGDGDRVGSRTVIIYKINEIQRIK